MLRPTFSKRFQRDLKRMRKRGKKVEKLKEITRLLVEEEPLPERCREHNLVAYPGRSECHIEPDWLLVYKITASEVIFERTGTHSDLFG